ncbi:hypothetical protein BGZ46_001497, partial [Entomortierella lignicola]
VDVATKLPRGQQSLCQITPRLDQKKHAVLAGGGVQEHPVAPTTSTSMPTTATAHPPTFWA